MSIKIGAYKGMPHRTRARSSVTGRMVKKAYAEKNPATTEVEKVEPRHRDVETMAALGRVEAVLSSVERIQGDIVALLKDIRGGVRGRFNHKPDDWR